jgi:metallo-beta-lactamase class B
MTIKTLLSPLLIFSLCFSSNLFAQNNRSTDPSPAFRIIGNLYAVGGSELNAFLITSDEGHILINTAFADSAPLIQQNIESLGFDLADVRILLAQHAHFDHTAAMAEIKNLTGAQMWASAEDVPLLEDGGLSDPHHGSEPGFSFTPIEVDRVIADGDIIELGENQLTVHIHPGHTAGATSFSMQVNEDGRDYRVLIANMGTINAGKRLAVNPTYEGAAADFAYTFVSQKAMDVDIWVAAHSSQYNRDAKWQPGQAYSPDNFYDPDGFKATVEYYENLFLEALAAER